MAGTVQGIDRKRSLEGIPVLNPGVTVDASNPLRIVITVRIRRGTGLLAVFQPPVMERRVKLDEPGSFVVAQVDGKRNAGEIIERFAERFRVNRREAELSCIEFIKSLVRRNAVSIVIE